MSEEKINIVVIDLEDGQEYIFNVSSYEEVQKYIEEDYNLSLQEWLDLEPDSEFNLDNYSLSEILEEWIACEELRIKFQETNSLYELLP